jgi:transposase
MIRMLIIGYCFGIRSERRLSDEVDLNLAYRWFCRLGLEGCVPDDSTFSTAVFGTATPFAMCSRRWFSAP